MSNICFILTCLTIPLFLELFDIQSKLSLSSTGHTIVEVLIVLGIFWLILLIDRFDRWLYLRSLSHSKKHKLIETRVTQTKIIDPDTSIQSDLMRDQDPTQPFENNRLDLSSRYSFHTIRLTFSKLINKNG